MTSSNDVEQAILNKPQATQAYGAVAGDLTVAKLVSPKNFFQTGVSAGLDIFKGFFVFFMLCEHSRAAASLKENESEAVFGVYVTAHSLDMVCYSFAYGFSCYGAYLSDSKPRSSMEKWGRLARSVLLIWGGCVVCDIFFSWSTHGMPTLHEICGIVTGKIVFWDFLRAFPFMLLTMTLLEPVVAIADRSASVVQRVCAMTFMVGLPLFGSSLRCSHEVCSGTAGGYLCFLVPCNHGTRFPALPYTALFNVGVLTAGWVRRVSEGQECKDRAVFLMAFAVSCIPFAYLYVHKVRFGTVEGANNMFLTDHFMDHVLPFEISRIPPTPGWLMATLGVGLFIFIPCIAAGIALQQFQEGYYLVRMVQAYFEHLGANVLLYLVLSNMLLLASRGWRGRERPMFDDVSGGTASEPFERTVIMMATIGFFHYLARSSRK